MKNIMKLIAVLLFFSLLAGCGAGKPARKPQEGDQGGQARQEVRVDQDLAGRVKSAAKTVRGVQDSTAVVVNREISTAVKVSGLDRFRLKSIREEVHQKLSEMNGGYEVHVTTDKKIFSELQKIERQIERGPAGPADGIKKKFDRLNNDMQG